MRISLISNLDNASPVESCVRELAQARDEGFARVWFTQMPFDVDLLTVLAVALREVPDIEVASGVLPIQNQHPSLLAQRALTLNMIGDGRFTLGIGVTHRAVTEGMWGISWDKSVKRLSEYLDGLLPAAGRGAGRRPRRARHDQGRPADPPRTDPPGVRRRARSADAAGRWSAHRGHDHLDDGPEDATRTRRTHAARRSRGSRTPGRVGRGSRRAAGKRDRRHRHRPVARRSAIRDVRPPAVLSRDAR